MKALVDGDIVAYRCAASCEPTKAKPQLEPESEALIRTEGLLQDILHDTGAGTYQVYLGGKQSFRKRLDSNYKANRTRPEPTHLQAVKNYILQYWDAKITDDIEADDALGIEQTLNNRAYHSMLLAGQENGCSESIICSIDKDLLQVPGFHYNFVKKESQEISNYEGAVNFYTQMILGDKSDNVMGYDGKARSEIPQFLVPMLTDLKELDSEKEMFSYVYEMYDDKERFERNYKLLWIWREENTTWDFLQQQLKVVSQ